MKEDLRVQKTKAALFSAFYSLLSQKRYDDITVNELCERAMVRRATFYKHYRDKQDFLVAIIKKFHSDFDDIMWREGKPAPAYDYFIKYSETLMTLIDKYAPVITNILRGPMREPFMNIIIQQNYIEAKNKLEAASSAGLRLATSVDIAAGFITGGIALLMIKWFEDGRCTPRNQVLDDLAHIIRSMLTP